MWRRRCGTSIGERCVGERGGSDGIGVHSVEPVVKDQGPAGRIHDRDTEAYLEQVPLLVSPFEGPQKQIEGIVVEQIAAPAVDHPCTACLDPL